MLPRCPRYERDRPREPWREFNPQSAPAQYAQPPRSGLHEASRSRPPVRPAPFPDQPSPGARHGHAHSVHAHPHDGPGDNVFYTDPTPRDDRYWNEEQQWREERWQKRDHARRWPEARAEPKDASSAYLPPPILPKPPPPKEASQPRVLKFSYTVTAAAKEGMAKAAMAAATEKNAEAEGAPRVAG